MFERAQHIGGRARIAAQRRGRDRWHLYLEWLSEQLRRTGVDLRLGVEATVDDVLSLDPDLIVASAGSTMRSPSWAAGSPEPGPRCRPDRRRSRLSPRFPVQARSSPTTREGSSPRRRRSHSSPSGWTVRIATTLPAVASFVDATQVWWVRRRLKKAGVELIDSVVPEHDGTSWTLVDLESEERRPTGRVDLVVVAGPRRSAGIWLTSSGKPGRGSGSSPSETRSPPHPARRRS